MSTMTPIATAKEVRKSILRMVYESGASHVGPALSVTDILVAIYAIAKIDPKHPFDSGRDRVILSKGHASAALYAVLAEHRFFDKERIGTFCKDGSFLGGHPDVQCVPGVETTTGSLGHGLPVGVGMALAARIQQRDYKVFVIMGDGEINEGSVWEAALSAGHHKLSNLIAIVDRNNQQGMGRADDVLCLEPIDEKFASFGWHAAVVDGHDLAALDAALCTKTDKPLCIVANTIKGKGVSYMEDQILWHYRNPNTEQYAQALKEIDEI